MDTTDMIDDCAEFAADCAVRLRVFSDWTKRSAQGAQTTGRCGFEEFVAVHPLMAERAVPHEASTAIPSVASVRFVGRG